MSVNGYATYKTATQTKTDDPRDIEYRLLAHATSMMMRAKETTDIKELVSAVLKNRDVWAALREDLMSEQNQLPKNLRASLVSVSLWIEKETLAVMDRQGDLDALIDINRNIMAGLKPEHAYEPSEASIS